jgi:uncharacterized protein YggE
VTPLIVTTGEGVVKKAPDRAWVTIAADSRAKTAADAQRQNTEAMTAVLDKIKAQGIPADAIQTTAYNVQPEYDYQGGRPTLRGYSAHNQVEVRVDPLGKLGDVMANAVNTGATNVSSVRFDIKDREAAESEALRLAVHDARRRADAIAAGASVRIAQVMRIDEQRSEQYPVQPMAMARMAGIAETAAAPPPVPIAAGEIEIRARVTLTVRIE